ncbi:PKD domain-containing protein [Leifsonia virtsii]|uniref:PKD domain-containing protein n=1 Tax=Leifsonia virtsii TaxID=3035915 RepID=A0ABT8ISX6_9MICO|nr:hypothetical protein [Leifsonia virtsii]MDN4595902.1 hypothetical protein [Leifsonia virtsii]
MTTVASNNFEGGRNGVAISTGNSGGASGTAFDIVFGTGLTYSSSAATQGSMGATTAGGAIGAAGWNLPNVTKLSAHMKFTISAVPTTGDMYLMRFHNGSTRVFDVHVQGTGKLRIFDAAGTNVWTGTTTLTPGTKYRLEAYVVAGSTTSNGTIKVGYYVDNSTTPVETIYNNTAANAGTGTNFTVVYLGKYNNNVESYTFDEFAIDSTLSDFIGIPAATPPTVSTPAIQNVPANATVNESVTASSSSGTIASYAWSFTYPTSGAPALTGATTANASFTASALAGKLYILQCVVTDSNSLTTTVTTEVRVPTSGDVSVLPGPAAAAVGTWSSIGGAATPGDALSDGSDTTYLESSPLSSTAQSTKYRIAPMSARSALTLTARLAQDTSGSTTAKVRLYEGTTQRQEWTQAITTSPTDYPLTLTTPSAITDWGNLYIELVGTAP